MKVLVIGKRGQVATCLGIQANTNPELDVTFASRSNLDLAKPDTIRSVLSETKPDIVINAAAYTLVDQAEDDEELAYAINGIAPGILAETAKENGAKIIHISTDYVFDGQQDRPYIETDPVAPLGVYGLSKLAGEKAVRAATDDYIILRTAWVYSPFGKNFLKTMIALAETREDISVVSDQHGNPTSAFIVADGLLAIAKKWQLEPDYQNGEIYHLAGSQETSWAGFAECIFDVSRKFGGPAATVNPITTDEFPTKTKRPANSRMNCSKFQSDFDFSDTDLSGAIEKVINQKFSI